MGWQAGGLVSKHKWFQPTTHQSVKHVLQHLLPEGGLRQADQCRPVRCLADGGDPLVAESIVKPGRARLGEGIAWRAGRQVRVSGQAGGQAAGARQQAGRQAGERSADRQVCGRAGRRASVGRQVRLTDTIPWQTDVLGHLAQVGALIGGPEGTGRRVDVSHQLRGG